MWRFSEQEWLITWGRGFVHHTQRTSSGDRRWVAGWVGGVGWVGWVNDWVGALSTTPKEHLRVTVFFCFFLESGLCLYRLRAVRLYDYEGLGRGFVHHTQRTSSGE